MKRCKQKILSALLVLLLSAALLPLARVQALGAIDTTKDAALTIMYLPDDKPAPGVRFDLYRIADVSAAGNFP